MLEAQLSAGTVNARLAALKSFVTHAYKRKLCAFRLDDIKSVKAQTYKDTRGISIDQFQLLIDGIDRSTSMGKRDYAMLRLVESREAIKPRPSLLDLDVPLSVHPAPDILSLRVCSCEV